MRSKIGKTQPNLNSYLNCPKDKNKIFASLQKTLRKIPCSKFSLIEFSTLTYKKSKVFKRINYRKLQYRIVYKQLILQLAKSLIMKIYGGIAS